MSKPNYYAIIPAEVRYSEKLSPNAKLLYGEITCLTNKEGFCWAENKYFAELYKVHKKTVSKWISELEKAGFVKSKVIRNNSKVVDRRILKIVPTSPRKDGYPLHEKTEDNIYTNNINNIKVNSGRKKSPTKEKYLNAIDHFIELFPERNRPKTEAQKNKWIDTIRLADEVDNVNPRQLYRLIKTAREDSFWKDIFLALPALRKKNASGVSKLDQILVKFKGDNFDLLK